MCSRKAHDVPARMPPIAAISKGEAGGELSEMAELAEAGAVAFSDDGMPGHEQPADALGARIRRAARAADCGALPGRLIWLTAA